MEYKMKLTKEQEEILNGAKGETLAKVMETLIRYGELFGATEMVKITGNYNHLVTSFGLKALKAVYSLLDELIAAGAVSGQKFSADPRPLDPNVPANLIEKLVFNKFMAEPFDWSKALPFDYSLVAGQNVKLADLSASEVEARISTDVTADFLPRVEKIMQTTGVDLEVETDDVLTMPILVPMYFICEGALTAVVNGQTGRVAVSTRREKKSFPWVIEPLLYTILATFFLNLPFAFDLELLFLSGTVFALIFFAVMSEGRNSLIRNIILRGRASKAERIGKDLKIAEGRGILKNPYDNTPVFVEKNEQEQPVSVKIRFYSLGRLLGVFLRMLFIMGLPVLVAGAIRLAMIWGTDDPFMKYFQIRYGAAWFVLFGFICILYWIRGVRHDVYEHPLLYELKNGKKPRLMGSRASRRVGILSMFGVGKLKSDQTRVTLFELIREMGGIGIFAVCFIAFLLFGSVGAILL